MALEDVISEILAQAENERRKILEEGKMEAEAIVNNAKKEAKERYGLFKKGTERMVNEITRKQISTTNLKVNKMILESRKEIVDKLFAKLIEKINKTNLKEREKLIENLMQKASKEVDAAFVYSNHKDKQLVLNSKDIKFGGLIDSIGGIIVENDDRDMRINYTFEIFLEKIKELYLNEVTKRVFSSVSEGGK